MSDIATPRLPSTNDTALSYDYAAALDQQRSRVGLNALRMMFVLVAIFGISPFIADTTSFGREGLLIGLASCAFVAVPLAIRRAQTSSASEIAAYEEKLLRKRSR